MTGKGTRRGQEFFCVYFGNFSWATGWRGSGGWWWTLGGGGGPKLGVCDWALVASSTYRRSFRYLKTLEDAERTKRDPF